MIRTYIFEIPKQFALREEERECLLLCGCDNISHEDHEEKQR